MSNSSTRIPPSFTAPAGHASEATSRNLFLQQVAHELAHFKLAPEVFFRVWKQAAALAGAAYFGDGTQSGIVGATSQWDLQPNLQKISDAIGAMSGGERVFLAALVSFYDSQDGGRLLQRVGVHGLADLGGLDLQRRTLIAGLLLNYTGW